MGEGKTLPTYFCRNCENPLALGGNSKTTKIGASGAAFMFTHAMNVVIGPKTEEIDNRILRGGRCDVW
ncbi:unnamed protein product [Eruca vesicaria subsp. sativa]|uniref:Yippee domain-containing protein n=1 Tax=Eruca vesicaria subsp. sativa TaxID=29727 RepID=A0ABC8J8I6_ERUVS|nr:unnamed protein product [Eruca vesicaria subsp. sativa]